MEQHSSDILRFTDYVLMSSDNFPMINLIFSYIVTKNNEISFVQSTNEY